jgi:photosystem II stability/assembly factor-like uncharacterized protein
MFTGTISNARQTHYESFEDPLMRFKKTHIFIAVLMILFLNATSVDALSRFFTPQQDNQSIVEQAQPQASDPNQALGSTAYQAEGSDLQDFNLITEQEGWVLLGQNVYWTSDGGRRWENITPAGLRPGSMSGVHFLDTLNGWLAFADPNEAGEYTYSIARTQDRGRSWQVTKLNLFLPGDPDGFGDALYVQFIDQNTGYLVVRRATSTNFRVGTLFKTTDGGRSWARLSIPIGDPIHFTSENTGWVAGGASGEDLYQTQDGGRSWNRKQVNTPLKAGEKRLYRLPVFESDSNGLLPVVISDGNTARVEYHLTTNRGNSWRLLDSVPVGKGVYYGRDIPLSIFNNREWMIKLPNSRQSIKSIQKGPGVKSLPTNPVVEDTATPEPLLLPEETETNVPTETLTATESPVTQALLQEVDETETPPGVLTPEATENPPTLIPEATETEVPADIPATTETAFPPTPTTVATETDPASETTGETEIITVQSTQMLSESIRELDMVTTETGWAKTMQGNCDAIDPETPVNCTLSVHLLRTDDGGESWETLPLPENTSISLASYVNNTDMYLGQGFDSCSMPTLGLMQDWIVNSPYRVWNLYIGGSSRAGCGTLTSSYISALAQQGWKFIITWVGPQAACTTFSTRMSSNTTTAYNEGIAEANLAIDRAFDLGLTNPDKTGALIYYDLESYDTNNTQCRAAAKSFMDGWTKQLQARGNLSGVYGSPCSSAMSDFATNPNVPDTVWLAAWISPYQYRSNVSLTNLSCISNTLWGNKQRMRQYTGSHREAWGSSVLGSIDSNVIDSPVAVLDKNSTCPQSRGAILYWNNTYSCSNSSGDAGYRQYTNKGFNNISGAFNDQAASLRVPTGWSAMLYQDSNRGGGKICYNTNVANLANEGNFPGTNIAINKQVSSIEVFDNPSCSASPAPNPVGGYWTTTYFNDASLGTQCAVDTTPGPYLFKDWGTGSPNSKCSADNFSGRFTQTVYFPEGKYTFHLGADDRARMKIGSDTIIDRWSSTTTSSAVRTMPAGNYLITVEYAELTGSARVAAWWTGGGGFNTPRQTRDPNQWYAQYWGNTSQWWDSIVRVNEGTGPLNRQWGLGGPGYGLPSDRFSARYERDVTFECGTYNFKLNADDGVRFYINGQLYLDEWRSQSAAFNVSVPLGAGTHRLRVDHYDNLEAAQISLDWTRTSSCPAAPTSTATNPPPTPTNPSPTPTSAPPTETPVPMPDFLFKDGFENGSFSAWSNSVTDNGDLSVTSAAALVGTRGMQAVINDLNPLYVQHNISADLWTYRARFYFHPNSLNMADGEIFHIFNGLNSDNTPMLFLRFRQYAGNYQIQVGARTNNDVNTFTSWTNVSNAPHYVELEWKTGSPGSARIWLDGNPAGSLSVSNSKWRLRSARMGAVSGIKANTRGTMYFDEYEARTVSYIGPSDAAQVTPTATFTATKPPPTATFTATNQPTSAPTETPTAAPLADFIFSDGFESGNFSAWSGVAASSGNLSVSSSAALVGSHGMQAAIKDNNNLRVQYDMPTSIPRIRARFYLHPNSLTMAEGDNFMLFLTQNSGGTRNLQIEMRRSSGKYQIRGALRVNSGLFVYTAWTTLSNARHFIEIDAKAASSSSVSDGYLTLWLNGSQVATRTGLNNSNWVQKRAVLGAVLGIDSGTRGTLFLDEFEVRSSSYIGKAAGDTGAPPTATPTTAPTATPTAAPLADFLFSDSFESGNFSAWSAAATDGGDLSVTTASALVGTRGMRARINDNNNLRVQYDMPTSIPRIRARFYIHPNSLTMTNGDNFMIFLTQNSGGTRNLQIEMRRSSGKYQIRGAMRVNSGLFVYTAWTDLSNARHFIEIDAKAASSSSVSDGYLTLWLNGSQVATRTGLNNSNWVQKRAVLGAVLGIDSGTRGTLFLDEFEVRSSSYIGKAAGDVGTPPTATPTTAPTTAPTAAPTATPTTKPADQIFADGFESGNLSAWTSSLTDSGDLSVTTASALVGTRGMQARINDNTSIYVHNTLPTSYNRYRMRFYFHPNSLTMAEGDLFNIYNAYNASGSSNVMIRLRRSSGNYQIQVAARDNSTWILTGWYTLSNARHYIEIDWKAATTASPNSGFLYLYTNGTLRTSLALTNSNWLIARERLGAVEGIDAGTRGTIFFDAFESRKSTYIGP